MTTATSTWATQEFRAELSDWIAGIAGPVTELEQVRMRPWSAVWRAVTPRGVAFAKQNCPGQLAEAAVVEVLAELVPDRVIPVWGVDADRGLLLTPDQGVPLADRGTPGDPVAVAPLLVAAARLQREVGPDVDRLAAVGLRTMRPEDAAGYAETMIDRLAGLPADDPRAISAETAGRLTDHLPVLCACGELLAGAGLPITLNHNDLHDHNVFLTDDGRVRFFDFGDAMATEPLGVLRIPVDLLREQEGAPDWRPVVDPALEVWSDLVPMTELRSLLPAALHLNRLARTESWWRCIASFDEAELAEFGGAPAGWLASLLGDDPEELPGGRQ